MLSVVNSVLLALSYHLNTSLMMFLWVCLFVFFFQFSKFECPQCLERFPVWLGKVEWPQKVAGEA